MDSESFDYSVVLNAARIAVYDDLLSAPRVIQINPGPTNEFIETLSDKIYSSAQLLGGQIPYSAIREVTENFIHAQFSEIVVSILDKGNTIRFADQGPGILNKEKAQLPGFTSATEPMKAYIRGVGSGLTLVKEYLSFSKGKLSIEDNLSSGAVVTLSLSNKPSTPQSEPVLPTPALSQRERDVLVLFKTEGALGVTDINQLTGMSSSTIFNTLKSLQETGLLQITSNKKRILTDFGKQVVQGLL